MASNGKSKAEQNEVLNLDELDLEHELPAGEEGEEVQEEAGTAGPPVTAPAPPAAASAAEAESLRRERDALLDRLARLQAEFENARKRTAREAQEYRDYAVTEAVKSLLPVMDSFERALKAEGDGSEFRSGVELIYRQLQDVLRRLGVEAVKAEGQPFDPTLHEAVQVMETDEAADNTVIEEFQRGYRLRERLLRPAMVRVAHKPRS